MNAAAAAADVVAAEAADGGLVDDIAEPGLYAVITEFIWPEEFPWIAFEQAVFDGSASVPASVPKLQSIQSCILGTLQQDVAFPNTCTARYIRFPSVPGHGLLVGPCQDMPQEFCNSIFQLALLKGYVRDRLSLIGIKFHPPCGAWEFFRGPWINYCDLPEHARKKMHLPEPEWQGWRGLYKHGSNYALGDSQDYHDMTDVNFLEYNQENFSDD